MHSAKARCRCLMPIELLFGKTLDLKEKRLSQQDSLFFLCPGRMASPSLTVVFFIIPRSWIADIDSLLDNTNKEAADRGFLAPLTAQSGNRVSSVLMY